MDSITFSLGQIVSLAGGVTAIITCYKLLSKPYADIKERVEKMEKKIDSHEQLFARDKAHLDKIDELLDETKQSNQLTQKMLFLILNHSIDGNGVSEMKKLRDSLVEDPHFLK